MNEAAELTCRELVELVTDYLEDALSLEDRARFEQHLSVCDGCANYLHQMSEAIRLTGASLTEEHLDPARRDQLLTAFRAWRDA